MVGFVNYENPLPPSNQEGLGTSRFINGQTTRDPYSQEEHIEISNILKVSVYWAYIERDTDIQKLWQSIHLL